MYTNGRDRDVWTQKLSNDKLHMQLQHAAHADQNTYIRVRYETWRVKDVYILTDATVTCGSRS